MFKSILNKFKFFGLLAAFFIVILVGFSNKAQAYDFSQDVINNQRQQISARQSFTGFMQDLKNNKKQQISVSKKKTKKIKGRFYIYDLKAELRRNKLQEVR